MGTPGTRSGTVFPSDRGIDGKALPRIRLLSLPVRASTTAGGPRADGRAGAGDGRATAARADDPGGAQNGSARGPPGRPIKPDVDFCIALWHYGILSVRDSAEGRPAGGLPAEKNSSTSHCNDACKPVSVCELIRIKNIGLRKTDPARRIDVGVRRRPAPRPPLTFCMDLDQ